MNSSKTLIGALIAGIVSFFSGWLIYGILLASYMESNAMECSRPMEEMIMGGMVLSNLVAGLFYALIYSWSNIKGWIPGMQKGAILGLLYAVSLDAGMYSMTTMFSSINEIIVDVVASTAMATLTGAALGWWMGRGSE